MSPRRTAGALGLFLALVLAAPAIATQPVSFFGSGALATGQWVGGTQTQAWGATNPDGTGLYYGELGIVGGPQIDVSANELRFCPLSDISQSRSWNTASVSDGTYTLYIGAVDCENEGGVGHELYRTVHIDNHPPDQPQNVTVSGGEGWHASNDFSLSWANPVEQFAPIGAARFKLCLPGQDPAACPASRSAGSSLGAIAAIKVPAEGDYTARLWLEDAAGNADDGRYVPVHLRYDATPPASVTFQSQNASDPRRVEVAVTDSASGLGSGQIELRKFGTSAWQPMPTTAQGSTLIGQINDRVLSKGQYELRAAARDRAGNERGSSQLADGSSAGFAMPLRAPVEVQAGFPKNVRVRGAAARKRKSKAKQVQKLISVRRVRFGRAATVVGYVRDANNGQPIGGAEVQVLARPRLTNADFHPEATVMADGNGRFKYRAPAAESRLLQFDYDGTAMIGGGADSVRLRVPGSSSLRASKRHARNGETVRFGGRLRGKPYPAGGKIVVLQVYARSRWRTFGQTRTRPTGTWSYRYRFDGSPPGRTRYRFRARIPRESGVYPYEFGNSGTRDVIVRG